MASLSEDMKSKREVKRRSTVLIIDKDLGNYGLYKSILAMEYELDCINSIQSARNMCDEKHYDVILVDGGFETDDVEEFYVAVKTKYKKDRPILLVLAEPHNKETIIEYLGIGAREYIPKPFTKEGITNTIYEQLKRRRENTIRKSILIVDEDYEQLRELKSYLIHKYRVACVNSYEMAKKFMMSSMPDLTICDLKLFEKAVDDVLRCKKEEERQMPLDNDKALNMPVLITSKVPDGEAISKCARFNPEGFLIRPIDKDTLLKTLERIFLIESYTNAGR